MKNNYNVYYNIFSFTNWLKIKIGKSANLKVSIKFIINKCLFKAVKIWYNNKLDNNIYNIF